VQRSEITIDLGALRQNVRTLLTVLAGSELWAVVKANAYGHGAVDVARAALESGCPIDLHPRVFRAGQCAQTLLARASVILWQLTEEPRYRLLVRPSFAAYVAAWLTDAVAAADA